MATSSNNSVFHAKQAQKVLDRTFVYLVGRSLESSPHVRAKDKIVEQIAKHRRIYKSAVFRGAVVQRTDIAEVRDKWLLYLGVIKLAETKPAFQFREYISRDNFLLFEVAMDLHTLIESLEGLCQKNIFDLGKVVIEFPQVPGIYYNYFYDSERSKEDFGIDWATKVWQIEARQGWGTSNRELELESEDMPFRDLQNAIEHYLGVRYRRNVTHFNNKISIMFPYYYARIEKCVLSERKLEIAFTKKKAKLHELTIKYNCPTNSGRYIGNTISPEKTSIVIDLADSAKTADVWLFHNEVGMVDFRYMINRILNLEEVQRYLSDPKNTYYPESIVDSSVAQAIKSYSEDFKRSFGFSTEECIDTVDQEVLKSIKVKGKSYREFASPILQWLPAGDFLRHLGKLHALNHLYITDENKIALTAQGVGVTLMPPSSLIPRVPQDVAMKIAEIRVAFLNGNFDKVINDANILFEHILRNALQDKFGEDLERKWKSLDMKPWDRATVGDLKTACIKFKIFSEKSVESKLLEVFSSLRVPISHKRPKRIDPPSAAKITLDLIEMFVRYWYYQI